jgi:hypothetical protein
MYQGQKVHFFLKRHFLAEVDVTFFRRPHELQSKDIIGKITNLFCIYFFQIDKLIINNFFYSICYQLASKTRNLLFAIQLLIYIIYGGRRIIGFVGFVANLLNRATDGATVSVQKRVTFRSLVGT